MKHFVFVFLFLLALCGGAMAQTLYAKTCAARIAEPQKPLLSTNEKVTAINKALDVASLQRTALRCKYTPRAAKRYARVRKTHRKGAKRSLITTPSINEDDTQAGNVEYLVKK